MNKKLKKVRKLLKERSRESTLKEFNDLSEKKQIEFLERTTIAYKAGLKPRELNPLIDIFKQFKSIAKQDPSRLEIKLLGIIDEHNTAPVDEEKLKKQLAKTFNIEERRIISTDTRSISADLLKCINHINAKCDFISNIDLYLKELSEKRLEKDWGKRIEKLEALQELYPIKENISEIFKTTSNAAKLDIASDWMNPLMQRLTDIEIPTDKELKEIFEDEYPGFKIEFKMSELNNPIFAKGMILHKGNVSKALKFIFEIKHPGDTITANAIQKRYNKKSYW